MSNVQVNVERLLKIAQGEWKRHPREHFFDPVRFEPSERFPEEDASSYSWYHTLEYTDGAVSMQNAIHSAATLRDNIDQMIEGGAEALGHHLKSGDVRVCEEAVYRLDGTWLKRSVDAIHQLIDEIAPKVFMREAPYGEYLSSDQVPMHVMAKRSVTFRLHFRYVVWTDGLVMMKPEVSIAGCRAGVPVSIWHSSNDYLPNETGEEVHGVVN
jgi:hypothetical protein